MIIKKTEYVPAKEQEVFDKRICDICGNESNSVDNWARDGYEFCETEVKISQGERFPEVGSWEDVSFDICGECFQGKLIPFFELLGAKPTVKEFDY